MVREDLLDLVMSGAWRSSSERRVVKYESRRSVRVTGGFVMRGVEPQTLPENLGKHLRPLQKTTLIFEQ